MIDRQYKSQFIVVLLTLLLLTVTATAQSNDISVSVALNRNTIGMDEQALLTVTVESGIRDLPPPDLPTLSMFDVQNQGRSSNYQIINGVASSSVSYRYGLLPKKAGVFPISGISLVYQNKRYKGNEVQLTVLEEASTVEQTTEERARDRNGESSVAFLEAEVDKSNPYVNEQVTLTLKFYISVRHSTPDLSWPTFNGFWHETLGNSTTYNQQINNRTYKVYEIKRALFPTQTGELDIDRALITTTVSRDFFMFGGEQISGRSQPITINVQPLPDAGRPDNFTGTIGKFNLGVSIDKTEVEVNQPITMTVRVSGTGNIKAVAEPIIPEQDNFRVYLASSKENISKTNDRLGGTKIFEEVFVPKRPGDLQLPAMKYNFFNPNTRKYEEVASRPMSVKVTGGDGMAANTDLPYSATGITVGNQASDIRYLKQNLGSTSRPGYLTIKDPVYLLANALPVLLLAGTIVVRIRREKLSSNVGYARSRAATKQARKRLGRARSLANAATTGEFYAEISQAATSFIADKLNISPYGLTSDRITDLLHERGAADDMIEQTVTLLRKCDFARFAASQVSQADIEQSLQLAEDLMVRMGGLRFD